MNHAPLKSPSHQHDSEPLAQLMLGRLATLKRVSSCHVLRGTASAALESTGSMFAFAVWVGIAVLVLWCSATRCPPAFSPLPMFRRPVSSAAMTRAAFVRTKYDHPNFGVWNPAIWLVAGGAATGAAWMVFAAPERPMQQSTMLGRSGLGWTTRMFVTPWM
jgi:hypothetical protein